MLADGAIETRLVYEFGRHLPEFASFLPLFDEAGRAALERIYRSYLTIAAESGLKMQVGTPTWRAHPDALQRLGFGAPGDLARVNRTAVAFLCELRQAMGVADLVYVAGVIGPRGDGYNPAAAPDLATARAYHAQQATVLADAGVDLLYAPTFASANELRGVAAAMAATGLPYVVAPVLGSDGRMPDGTTLDAMIAMLDDAPHAPPVHVMIGCVHAGTVDTTLATSAAPSRRRLAGVKANASALPPEQLDRLDHVEADTPAEFARQLLSLHRSHGLKILGGCCGTDDRHIRAVADALRRDWDVATTE